MSVPILGRPTFTSIPHFNDPGFPTRPCGWYGWYGWYGCWYCWFWLGSKFWLVPKSPAIGIPSMPICPWQLLVLSLQLAYKIPLAQLPKPVGQSSNAHEAVVHANAVAGTNTLSTLAHLRCWIWWFTCIIMPIMTGCQLYHIFSNTLAVLLIHWIQKQVI